jgi:excinuclease ABC subunit C
MDKFSAKKDYEKAAIYRDRVSALRDIQRSQSVTGYKQPRDAIYLSKSQGSIKIGVTHVNQGWITGHNNFTQLQEFIENNILERFIINKYSSEKFCPAVLVIGKKLENKLLIEKALTKIHSKKISLITRPGKKDRGLLELSKANTEFVFKKDKVDKQISSKIEELVKDLKLSEDIQLIESYDISHHGGDYAVAGCVVFSKEGKERSLYRSYNISESNSGNDIGSMKELIERRFLSNNSNKLPGLIIIDGGKTHLSSVVKKLKPLNNLNLNIISISKGVRRKSAFDSIHLMNGGVISVKEGAISHNFIQEIRDETHRYAISLQKRKRSKSSMKSSLDGLSGIGPKRKKMLLRYFGSLEQIKRASIDDLSAVSGIGKNIAKSIYQEVHS